MPLNPNLNANAITFDNIKKMRTMCYMPSDSHEEYIEKRYKEFVLYFRELDKIGAPYGTSDLIIKAQELGLPIPKDKEIEGIKEIISREEINEMIDKKLIGENKDRVKQK